MSTEIPAAAAQMPDEGTTTIDVLLANLGHVAKVARLADLVTLRCVAYRGPKDRLAPFASALWVGGFGESTDPERVRLRSIEALSRSVPASSLRDGSAVRELLLDWAPANERIGVQRFQDTVHVMRLPSANGWTDWPCWRAEMHYRYEERPAIAMPAHTPVRIRSTKYAGDSIGAFAASWLGVRSIAQSSMPQDSTHLIIPDRRARIVRAAWESGGLRVNVESPHAIDYDILAVFGTGMDTRDRAEATVTDGTALIRIPRAITWLQLFLIGEDEYRYDQNSDTTLAVSSRFDLLPHGTPEQVTWPTSDPDNFGLKAIEPRPAPRSTASSKHGAADKATHIDDADQLNAVHELQNLLIAAATGGVRNDGTYREARRSLLASPSIASELPPVVLNSHDLSQFWEFIKGIPGYKARRTYLYSQFSALLARLEDGAGEPPDRGVTAGLNALSPEVVRDAWTKAVSRLQNDPDGAITAARTLVETACKCILEAAKVQYGDDADLPDLYKLTAETLNLAPSRHAQLAVKRILGGCTSVVEGIGTLRNKLGDAHGSGPKPVKPQARHARLVVSLAGAMAMFLVETWHANTGPR